MGKVIVVNLGNKGVILSVKDTNKIVDKFFLDHFSHDTLPKVVEFFNKYKNLDAYIVLDTVAQNYNYKIFPPLNFFDLQKIVVRRFNSEIPKHDLKKKKFLYKNSIDKRSVYLFISASVDSPLREWFNFFNTVPNNLLGIYLVPLEAIDLAKRIIISTGLKKPIKEKNNWILITFNDQTSDLRQVAIFNNNIAFTRLISFDPANGNLAEFSRNDIVRTSEYIRRFDSEFTFDKLTSIMILDEANKEAIKDLKVEKAIILNYTPYEIAKTLKLGGSSIDKNEKFMDLILSLFIFKNRNRIRFDNRKINITYNVTLAYNIMKNFLIIALIFIMISFAAYLFIGSMYDNEKMKINKALENDKTILSNKSEVEFGMESSKINIVIDAVNIRNMLNTKYVNPVDSFERFYDVQSNVALTNSIKWSIADFDYLKSLPNNVVKITYDIDIINPDGDANRLFGRYDALNSKLKDVYKGDLTSVTELPNTINFSEKYLSYPIKIEITERK